MRFLNLLVANLIAWLGVAPGFEVGDQDDAAHERFTVSRIRPASDVGASSNRRDSVTWLGG